MSYYFLFDEIGGFEVPTRVPTCSSTADCMCLIKIREQFLRRCMC
jgi:hypothetical protein